MEDGGPFNCVVVTENWKCIINHLYSFVSDGQRNTINKNMVGLMHNRKFTIHTIQHTREIMFSTLCDDKYCFIDHGNREELKMLHELDSTKRVFLHEFPCRDFQTRSVEDYTTELSSIFCW